MSRMLYFALFPREENAKFIVTQLYVIGAVFNFKVIGKVVD